jgi:hypothetical protein
VAVIITLGNLAGTFYPHRTCNVPPQEVPTLGISISSIIRNSWIVGNLEVMSIAKWYLRSTSACAVIKEPVSALPGSAFRGTVETEDYLEGSLVGRERKRRKKINPFFL